MREQMAQALDVLAEGMRPFIEERLRAIYRERWEKAVASSFRGGRGQAGDDEAFNWDAHAVLTVLWDQWNSVFRHHLSPLDRSLVAELREFRNRWAHQAEFDFEDTYRVFDSVHRLLAAVEAEEADEIARQKRELMRHEFSVQLDQTRQSRAAKRRKWRDLAILTVCCTVVVAALFYEFRAHAWVFASFVVLGFVYLITQRLMTREPVWYSARECPQCGRVIYGAVCPYCAPPRAG